MCTHCAKRSGAPFQWWLGFPTTGLRWIGEGGEPTWYDTYPGKTARGFCCECGTPPRRPRLPQRHDHRHPRHRPRPLQHRLGAGSHQPAPDHRSSSLARPVRRPLVCGRLTWGAQGVGAAAIRSGWVRRQRRDTEAVRAAAIQRLATSALGDRCRPPLPLCARPGECPRGRSWCCGRHEVGGMGRAWHRGAGGSGGGGGVRARGGHGRVRLEHGGRRRRPRRD
ncbi:hypothetical protein ACFTWD_35740 [Streptomyces sp. NPDC056943]|uniref:hypothetical protein n=1 Tax=Streptomyces sp. NPDC056943 TaxID=3345971 RepID=UPI00362568AB